MKRTILFAIASLLALASPAVLSEKNIIPNGGDSIVSIGPRMIKSIYAINNGSQRSVSESVTVWMKYNLAYNVGYDWISPTGDTTKELLDNFTWNVSIYSTVLSIPVKMMKVNSDDPNEYVGSYEGHVGDASLPGYEDTYAKFDIMTKTDPDSFKIAVYAKQTNNITEVYQAWDIPTSGEHTDGVYDLPALICQKTGFKILDNRCEVSNLGDAPVTNIVSIGSRFREFKTTSDVKLATLNMGTEPFAITNGVDVVIPSMTSVSATANDSQTKIGIILE